MPSPDRWDDEDDFYYRERFASGGVNHVPAPRRQRSRDAAAYGRRSDFLMPEHTTFTSGLHRSRSHGHGPVPNVTIYNTSTNDLDSSPHLRADQKSPMASPRGRPLRMPGEFTVEDELAELRLQVAENRVRSRSVSRRRDSSPDYDRWKLEQTQQELRQREERERIRKNAELKYMKEKAEKEEEEERIRREKNRFKTEWELQKEREELKAERRAREKEEEMRRIIAENTAKLERQEREAKEARQRAVDDFNKKKAEEEKKAKEERKRAVDEFNMQQAHEEKKAKEEEARIIAHYERQKFESEKKKQEERERILMEMKIEEEKRKQKEKEEWERFLRKQKEQEEKEKAKKDEEERQLEEAMRKRLHQYGFQENQVQAIVKPPEKQPDYQQNLQQGLTPLNPVRLSPQPTYVKVRREHLATETLHYYDIPYEIDRSDPDYIIILREMDAHETEILFEHTRRLRVRGPSLLIEERRDRGKNEFAWVRRRKHSVSPARRRGSPKRVVGIKEMFF